MRWAACAPYAAARAQRVVHRLKTFFEQQDRIVAFTAEELTASARGIAHWLAARQIPSVGCRVSTDGASLTGASEPGHALLSPSLRLVDGVLQTSTGWRAGFLRDGDLVVIPTADGASRPSAVGTGKQKDQGFTGYRAILQHVVAELADGRMDGTSRAAILAVARRFLAPRLKRRSTVHGRLGPTGGLVWQVEAASPSEVVLSCVDAGGVLETRGNTESDAWPPQAAGMYYADAFAAAVFARLAMDDVRWRSAARAAMRHVIATYRRYPAAPIWYHHEFKNAALAETAAMLGESAPPWLHGDSYEPTNVMAVRLHWLAARAARPQRGDMRRIARCRAVLLARQAPNGLFRDDRPPLHGDVHDLSYHLFALGFIARYLSSREDAKLQAAFRRGCMLVRDTQLRDGQVALCGRGTNNSYQTAAAIYALTFAETRFPAEGFGEGAAAAWHYLSKWRQDDGWFPVACNGESGARMGWNHCATPYNALVAYFLLCTADLVGTAHRRPMLARADGYADGRFARLRTAGGELAFVAAFNGGYAWSGRHLAGIAGATGLSFADACTVTLSPESLVEPRLDVTDLPEIRIGDRLVDWRAPGTISVAGGRLSYHTGDVTVTYSLGERTLHVELEVVAPTATSIQISGRLPLLARIARSIASTPRGFVIVGDGTTLEVGGDAVGGEPRADSVVSNPRGPGVLVTWPVRGTRDDTGRVTARYTVASMAGATRPRERMTLGAADVA